QVEDLTGPIARALCAVESAPAAAAHDRMVIDDLVRVGDLLKSSTRIPLGPARPAPGGLAQRLRRRLLAQPVTGRRLGGVVRVRRDLALQLRDPLRLLSDRL